MKSARSLIIVLATLIAAAPLHAMPTTVTNFSIPIPDNNPIGVLDTITFPSLALLDVAGGVEISVDISNSDISGLTLMLTDPNSVSYTLYDQGAVGTSLIDTYSTANPPLVGDLSIWTGLNPAGNWSLRVIDLVFLNNVTDGQVVSWSVTANPVPEPSALAITGVGILACGRRRGGTLSR